jgi:hypothetical protein
MRPKRSATETLRVIEESADADEAERILGLSDEELDRELADEGFDPKAVRARGAELAAQLGIGVPDEARGRASVGWRAGAPAEAPETAPVVVQASEPAPPVDIARARRRRRVVWLGAAAIAAGAVIVAVPAVVITIASRDPMRPDKWEASVETNEMRAAVIRRDAVAACEEQKWDACEQGLDTAKALDPAGEERVEVKKARRAVEDSHVPPRVRPRSLETK